MLKVDLNKTELDRVIQAAIQSLRRSKQKYSTNPAMVQLIDADISRYQHAINTAQETK